MLGAAHVVVVDALAAGDSGVRRCGGGCRVAARLGGRFGHVLGTPLWPLAGAVFRGCFAWDAGSLVFFGWRWSS